MMTIRRRTLRNVRTIAEVRAMVIRFMARI
jgi:hypothetical protein